MVAILGISAFYHDSAAALVVDGRLIAAAQEERFTRVKHDPSFPRLSVDYCLQEANLRPEELDFIVFYEKPLQKFDRLLETYLAYSPRGWKSFCTALPIWAKEKLFHRQLIRSGLPAAKRAKLLFTDHHESHAASAFFPSPFERAAILTIDGVGEWTTTAIGQGDRNRIELQHEIKFPHSLGLLYSAFTYYCGFKVNSGEYKLMGLAPYGQPVYRDLILKHLLQLRDDGSFRLNMDYFEYPYGLRMTSPLFHQLFGGVPRAPESRLDQRHMDLAASIQSVLEECVLKLAHQAHRQTGITDLVMAGGVALNCVANSKLLQSSPFQRIWIQPAAGDAGGALGAAWFVWFQLLNHERRPQAPDLQQGSFLGPQYASEEIQSQLDAAGAVYSRFTDETALVQTVARQLADGRAVGWFQGRMEFGPRALGARSILADPRDPEMQSRLNLKIKFRESFRPFAPAVLRDRGHDWFDLPPDFDSPYMLFTAQVRDGQQIVLSATDQQLVNSHPDLQARLKIVRSRIPAVTHVDHSARVQTVDAARHPRFYRLLEEFERITGCPLLANTSFNVRGEPIVCSPQDAWRCFLATDLDVLVLGDYLLMKNSQNKAVIEQNRQFQVQSISPD